MGVTYEDRARPSFCLYSPDCVEGEFSEVRQEFIANSLRTAQMLTSSNGHVKDRWERTER
jgi:hypothetical protein